MSLVEARNDKDPGEFTTRAGHIRRRNLPDNFADATPRTLRILCEHADWNVTDLATQFDTRPDIVERRLNAIGVTPSQKKSPQPHTENADGGEDGKITAADLWHADPEDFGFTSGPDDWDNTVQVDVQLPQPESHTLADFAGGDHP